MSRIGLGPLIPSQVEDNRCRFEVLRRKLVGLPVEISNEEVGKELYSVQKALEIISKPLPKGCTEGEMSEAHNALKIIKKLQLNIGDGWKEVEEVKARVQRIEADREVIAAYS